MKRVVVAALLCVVLARGVRTARADDSGISTPVVFAYVVPAIAAGTAACVNGALLLIDAASPRPWRLLGYISGGAELALGVGLFVFAHDTTSGVGLGVLSTALGVAALTAAYFVKVPDDVVGPVAVPGVTPHGAGVAFSTRF